jgi:nicotinate-nucleotide adenylyltransferase
MVNQRICLFGGTFDPIHIAHLRIAEEALTAYSLDRVIFIPAAHPPHKPTAGLTRYEHRFRMVEIACQPYPAFSASRIEEGRGKSYTVDTLRRFREEFGQSTDLFFLIGSDAFNELETWERWKELVTLTQFIVVSRPGGQYHIPHGAQVLRLDNLALPVSSSTIRQRLRARKRTPELPSGVREYIEEHGLYGVRKRNTSALPSRSTDRKLPSGV